MSTNNNEIVFHSEESRKQAMKKYEIIRPILMEQTRLSETAKKTGVPIRTLHSWIQKYSQFGLKGLIRKKRSDINSYRINQSVLEEIERLALSYRSASITSIHRKVCKYCNSLNLTSPSYKQVYSVIRNLTPSLKTLAFEGKKEYQNQFDLIYSREANYPNQIWQADHTLLDIIVTNEKRQPARPWLTIIIDDYSRAITGFSLSFQAPSAIQTALTLHHAIWKKENRNWPMCGIPESFYTDHGSDFTSTHLEQVAVDLKINLLFSTVGVPRGRGKIERFFLSINQLFLQDLPGYTKEKTTDKLITFKELENQLTHFILEDYHNRIHGTTKMTPAFMWNDSGFLPNLPESLEKLDLLLLNVAKPRKVHSDGIHFQGFRYMNINLAAYVGELVIIRYNPRDMAEIRVFYQEKYLCTAICAELSGFTVDVKEIVAARNKRRRELQKQIAPTTISEEIKIGKREKLADKETVVDRKKTKLKRYFNE